MTEDEEVEAALQRLLPRERDRELYFTDYLGRLPDCYPEPVAARESRCYAELRLIWSEKEIEEFVAGYRTDNLIHPGSLGTANRPSLDRFRELIGILAHGDWARSLPQNEMLTELAGEGAAKYQYSKEQGGKSEKPPNQWAQLLAKHFVRRFQEQPYKEIWNSLGPEPITFHINSDNWEISQGLNQNGKDIIEVNTINGVFTMAWSSFTRNYLRKARNDLKK